MKNPTLKIKHWSLRAADKMRHPARSRPGRQRGSAIAFVLKSNARLTQTGLSRRYSSVTSRTRSVKASKSGLSYTIVARGRPPTKPKEFPFRVKRGPGGGVDLALEPALHVPRSFQLQGYSGPDGLRMRIGEDRKPIRGFDGPNIAKEAVKINWRASMPRRGLVSRRWSSSAWRRFWGACVMPHGCHGMSRTWRASGSAGPSPVLETVRSRRSPNFR
jgi:hypothetical protein